MGVLDIKPSERSFGRNPWKRAFGKGALGKGLWERDLRERAFEKGQ